MASDNMITVHTVCYMYEHSDSCLVKSSQMGDRMYSLSILKYTEMNPYTLPYVLNISSKTIPEFIVMFTERPHIYNYSFHF